MHLGEFNLTQLQNLLRAFVPFLLSSIVTGAVFLTPLGILVWRLNKRRERYKAEAIEPFRELPLRPPGESLRRKIEEINEKFDNEFAVIGILCTGAGTYATCMTVVSGAKGVPIMLAGSTIILGTILAWRKLTKLQTELWQNRLGFDGERLVGEQLNRMVADGFHVFHDMPFDGFNIDHVLVGPPGVFAIETKTKRKPADLKGTDRATVIFDGVKLVFPRGNFDSDGIAQAERNAATLSKFLSSATGEPTKVYPLLTLPGWWVER